MKTVSFQTLGCKLNQYETIDLERQFAERGWRTVAFGEPADVVLVNTCTVTGKSDARCRAALRKARRTSPQATVVAAGCYAQVRPAQVAALPGVDLVLGNREKSAVFEHLDPAGRPRGGNIAAATLDGGERPAFVPIRAFSGRTRAFVKIQDGCDARCAYCSVRLARGPNRSLAPAAVLDQAQTLIDAGHLEVVLTGVHLGTWGHDQTPRRTLCALLERIATLPGLKRLRLSSIEPTEFTPELLDLLVSSPVICPHLHIPLQSGSASILRAMRRPYGPGDFAALVRRLAAALADPGIGADVIAGFPGEREADFAETVALIRALPLTYLHVFPFSPRPGTAAAALPDQIPLPERERRAALLRQLGQEKAQVFREKHVGRTLSILVEGRPGRATGLTGNYLKIVVRARAEDLRRFHTVRVTRHEGGLLHGELCD